LKGAWYRVQGAWNEVNGRRGGGVDEGKGEEKTGIKGER
jgi:hypothetical protein